jgi:hypothetical protein
LHVNLKRQLLKQMPLEPSPHFSHSLQTISDVRSKRQVRPKSVNRIPISWIRYPSSFA